MVTHGECTWRVWLNVTPAVLEESQGPGPRLHKDASGRWRVEGAEPTGRCVKDYEDFCTDANASGTTPQVVRITRRWPRARPAKGQK